MLTLTKASNETKSIIKWSGIVIGIIIILFILFRLAISVKEVLYPTPPPKPTVSFGKLTKPVFDQNASDQQFNYSLDTISGSLPTLPDQIKVYSLEQQKPNLLSLQQISSRVHAQGFVNGPFKVSDTIYTWSTNDTLPKKITANIINYNFTLSSSFYSDPAILTSQNLPNTNDAASYAQRYLSSMDYFPADIDSTKTITNLFTIENNILIKASSLSKAKLIQVNFVQKDVDDLPIYYTNPLESNISLLVGSNGVEGQIVNGVFSHQLIGSDKATYPIKSADNAFNDLKKGKAYIASYEGPNINIKIQSVFLAYYIGRNAQNYLMPIVVFKGDNGFFAYVNAIKDEWLSN